MNETKQEIDPVTGEMRRVASSQTTTQIIPVTDPEAVSRMSRSELEHAYRIACGAFLGVALASNDEIAQAISLKLAAAGLGEKDIYKALPALREWLDRTQGKSVQRIDQRISKSLSVARELTTDEIIARLSMAGQSRLESAGVKLIEGKVERIIDG